jgi:hypothetical protein
MRAGRDYADAKRHAQASADRSGEPHWLHRWGGVWWISAAPVRGGERIDPAPPDPAKGNP